MSIRHKLPDTAYYVLLAISSNLIPIIIGIVVGLAAHALTLDSSCDSGRSECFIPPSAAIGYLGAMAGLVVGVILVSQKLKRHGLVRWQGVILVATGYFLEFLVYTTSVYNSYDYALSVILALFCVCLFYIFAGSWFKSINTKRKQAV